MKKFKFEWNKIPPKIYFQTDSSISDSIKTKANQPAPSSTGKESRNKNSAWNTKSIGPACEEKVEHEK